MEATTTQKELWSYCSANDFISKEKIADFQQRLTEEQVDELFSNYKDLQLIK